MVVEDLRISGKRVFLLVTKRKAKCVEDNSIRVEEINWITERFTDRFAEQVYGSTSQKCYHIQAYLHYHESGGGMVFGIG